MPVYFIRAGAFGDVKIGFAANPLARLRQLQTSQPVKLRIIRVVEGDRTTEGALHQRFAAHRTVGEWFSFHPKMQSDLGIPDLPVPLPRRAPKHDLATARGRYHRLVDDLLEFIGGREEFAKSLRIAPWKVAWSIHKLHLSALSALAIRAGAPITFKQVLQAEEDAAAEYAAATSGRQTEDRAKSDAESERRWIKSHGADSIWWDRFTKDDETRGTEAAA